MMYDKMAEEYDRMTRFQERLTTERTLLEPWVGDPDVRTVLDAACGTGLHSIVLAGMGKKVTGADLSSGMLAQARRHAREQKAQVRFVHAGFGILHKKAPGPFDAVLCLGNSLPHLLTRGSLVKALLDFHRILKPGGRLLLQLINYDRVLKSKERLVGVRHDRELTFIRTVDFLGKDIRFNVLTLREEGGRATSAMRSTLLHPWRKRGLLAALKMTGFVMPEIYGGMNKKPYSMESSTDLVVGCQTPLRFSPCHWK
jgi:glycine/sarcosine N-methyltransferase